MTTTLERLNAIRECLGTLIHHSPGIMATEYLGHAYRQLDHAEAELKADWMDHLATDSALPLMGAVALVANEWDGHDGWSMAQRAQRHAVWIAFQAVRHASAAPA